MFTLLWERFSPKQRQRALNSAVIASIVAYLLLALVGEPLQSFQADVGWQASSGVVTQDSE